MGARHRCVASIDEQSKVLHFETRDDSLHDVFGRQFLFCGASSVEFSEGYVQAKAEIGHLVFDPDEKQKTLDDHRPMLLAFVAADLAYG